MSVRPFDRGIVTDEVARDLARAFEQAEAWGLRLFELREGGKARFPRFTREEVRVVEEALARGSRVTAVSPGIFKAPVEDRARLGPELDDVLPRSIDLAKQLGCRHVVVFGFARYAGEPAANRLLVLRAFERAAERADAAGVVLAVENEPAFWVDRPQETAGLLRELDHPALRVHWDPANAVWGGHVPREDDVEVLAPYLAGLHVKDCSPSPEGPNWKPVGEGRVPWPELLEWIGAATALPHVTIETHCEPLAACSEKSLDRLREMIPGS